MIDLSSVNKVYIVCGYTDLRKGIDGYVSIVEGVLKLSPYDKSLYIFCNKFKNKLKILHYEDRSFWLYYKRLEYIRINWPKNNIGIEISKSQIQKLLKGFRLESRIKSW